MTRRQRARVTVVGTLKGGVGKTRLAMFIALFLAVVEGRKVLVIDGDTMSQTSHLWQKHAKAAGLDWPVKVIRHPFEDVADVIDEHADDFDDIVCDIGGGNRDVLEGAITRAHRFLAPVGADDSEIDRLAGTWRCATAAAEKNTVGGVEAWVVLSRADHGTSEPRRARRLLTVPDPVDQEGGNKGVVYPLADTEMVKRVAYARAYKTVPRDFLDVPQLLAEIGMTEKETAA